MTTDLRTIKLGGFELTQTGVQIHGKPEWDDFCGAFDFVTKSHRASGFWLCDLITYADSRPEWYELADSVIDHEYLTEASIRQYRYLGKAIPPNQRVVGIGFGHHAEVASLPQDQRVQWLEKAKTEGWTQRELRQQVRVSKQAMLMSMEQEPSERFRVVVVEPSWGSTTVQDICGLPVGPKTLDDAVLFLWVPTSRLMAVPEILEAWGFTYQTSFVWHQVTEMKTSYLAVAHETLVIATKGVCEPVNCSLHSVQTFRRHGVTGPKPSEFLDLVEKMYPVGPYASIGGLEGRLDWALHSMVSFAEG